MFYKDGLNFSCTKCSACCRYAPGVVYLSLSDLEKLCKSFKMTEKEFAGKYCRWVMYYDGNYVLSLQETPEFDCIMWSEKGCLAYEARPVQCSTYPFWSWLLSSKQTWDEEKKSCPGINSGRLWTFEEIEEQKKLYDSIDPVRKNDFEKRLGEF